MLTFSFSLPFSLPTFSQGAPSWCSLKEWNPERMARPHFVDTACSQHRFQQKLPSCHPPLRLINPLCLKDSNLEGKYVFPGSCLLATSLTVHLCLPCRGEESFSLSLNISSFAQLGAMECGVEYGTLGVALSSEFEMLVST